MGMKKFLYENKEKIVAFILFLIFLMTCSFAWLVLRIDGQKQHILRAGNLELELDDEASEGILLERMVPVSDEKGLEGNSYTFQLKNKGSHSSSYTIYLDDVPLVDGEAKMNPQFVRYGLSKNGGEVVLRNLSSSDSEDPNDRILESGTIEGGTTNTYTLKVWIDRNADNSVMGTVFHGKIKIEAEQNKGVNSSDPTS